MGIVSQRRSLMFPHPESRGHNLVMLDAANEQCAFIVQTPASGNITDILWTTNAVGAGTFTLTIGIQGVDVAGMPDGIYKSAGAAKVDIASAGLTSNTAYVSMLGTAYTATRPELIAIVFTISAWTSGSVRVTGYQIGSSDLFGLYATFPYMVNDLGGAGWADNSLSPAVVLKIDGVYYHCNCVVPSVSSSVTAKNDNAPYELGNVIIPPWNCQVEGCYVWLTQMADNYDIILYRDSDNAVLQTLTIDKDNAGTASKGGLFLFATSQMLVKDVMYRLVIKPTTSTTNNVGLQKLAYGNADMLALTHGGVNVYGCIRTHATDWTWTDYLTSGYSQFLIGLILEGIDTTNTALGSSLLINNIGLIS